MKTIAHVLLAAIICSGLMALPLHAEEQLQRYIVVLRQRSGPTPDVASLGGKIEFRQDDQLVVTIPIGALAAVKADPKVRYVERVGGAPSDDDTPLIGVPSDPQPGGSTHASGLTPRALGSLAWDSGTYLYDRAGHIVSIGTDNYLYDGVQRLSHSSTKGDSETYTYDGFGNMQTRTNTIIPTVQPSTNRYDGYLYNEVGAATSDGSYVFSYDALGQPLSKIYNGNSSTLEYYIYTPGDERIGVQRGGWWTWRVRDEGGKVLRQYKSSATNPSASALWLEDFVWRDGLLLGSQRPVEMGGRRHFHLDHLGSPRLITADNGQMVSYHDYYPFGDEHSPVSQEVSGGFDREDPMKFTGHERDYAGGMGGEDGHAIDDMHARYYSPTAGRFLSVDPLLGDPSRPQSWNRYAYALNNPLRNTDPDGRCTIGGEEHGWLWCAGHALGLTMTQHERADVLRGYLGEALQNGWSLTKDGKAATPSQLSDQQVIAAYNVITDSWHYRTSDSPGTEESPSARTLNMMAPFMTQCGWNNTSSYTDAKNQLKQPGTHQTLNGKVPTQEEAVRMIEESGGKIDRMDLEGHAPGGVSDHTYPHINYTTSSGVKATVRVQ